MCTAGSSWGSAAPAASALNAAAELEGDAREATERYLWEMRDKLDTRDPLTSPERLLPVVSTPSNEDLRAFL